MSIKYIDLFAGVGGFHYGIDSCRKFRGRTRVPQYIRSNRDSSNSKGESWENNKNYYKNVYSNEWDKYANSVYKYHFGECDNRDIRDVSAEEIPDHDLLCGGFPCQAFSVAGKRRGFEDTRGTLFFEIARIAKQKQPRLLLLENVKGLLSHDSGNTFKTIIRSLDELGYDLQWQVLNSKDFGVPQNRERVFIIGNLRGTSRPEVFPVGGWNKLDKETQSEDRKEVQTFRCLEATEYKGYSAERFDWILQGRIRRLTPIECERLQGFPDNWTKYGHDDKEMSDTQRYKMMGNAVSTPVITAIAEKLLNGRDIISKLKETYVSK